MSTKIHLTVTNDLNYDQRMQRICRSLAEAGYEVTLVGRQRKHSKPLKDHSDILRGSFHQKRLKCFFDKGKFFYLEYNLRLLFFLLFQKTDIICGIDLDTIFPTWLVAKWRKRTFVYDAHEYFTETSSLHGREREKRIWKWVESFIVPKVKYAYTVNQSIANIFKTEYGTTFEVIRNVPVLQEPPSKENQKDKYILYQGALNKGRGLEFLISCMPDIDQRLIIAGDGPIRSQLEKMCCELGVEQKVEFLGFIFPEELKTVTENAWVGLNLIENTGLSYYYSLANKFFDYIHARIPQISMDFPEYRLLNDQYECGLLLPDFDKDIFINLIQQLENEKLYQSFVKNTLVARESLNWQMESKRLIEFYARIKPI
ncbi:MAG: glycosyltransferase [Bacteroidetes bacterium]|nr:MAG: glycosyltransferase [Bacteroidota bacterium]